MWVEVERRIEAGIGVEVLMRTGTGKGQEGEVIPVPDPEIDLEIGEDLQSRNTIERGLTRVRGRGQVQILGIGQSIRIRELGGMILILRDQGREVMKKEEGGVTLLILLLVGVDHLHRKGIGQKLERKRKSF
jgi:hypothetical protein